MSDGLGVNAILFEGRSLAVEGASKVVDLSGLDYDSLVRLKLQIENERKAILGQIDAARQREREGVEPFDTHWHGRARSALRVKGAYVSQVEVRMGAIRREKGVEAFPKAFMEAARAVLPPHVFDEVLAAARDRLTRASTAKAST